MKKMEETYTHDTKRKKPVWDDCRYGTVWRGQSCGGRREVSGGPGLGEGWAGGAQGNPRAVQLFCVTWW